MGFAKPDSTQTKITDYVGRLLVLEPTNVTRAVQTSYGPCDTVDVLLWTLDGEDSDGNGPGYEGEVKLFQRMLVSQTSGLVGQKVLGRLTMVPAKHGKDSVMYQLADPTDDDEKLAGRWEREEAKRKPTWSGSKPSSGSDDEPPF